MSTVEIILYTFIGGLFIGAITLLGCRFLYIEMTNLFNKGDE